MKTEMTIGMAALAALAVEGRNFDRAELNAMLDKLAASPEPKIARGPMAMCYKQAMPLPSACRHVCPKCGAVTRYFSTRLENDLAFMRDGAVRLKGMGLDIALDETALCRICAPGPKMPQTGRVAKETEAFAAGDQVDILLVHDEYALVRPRERTVWISAKYVDRENSVITANEVRARTRPNDNGYTVERYGRGVKVKILPPREGDPADWVRVDAPDLYAWKRGVRVPIQDLDRLGSGDGELAYDNRLSRIEWVVNGKRTRAMKSDVELLKTFLAGKLVLTEGRDEQVPLKKRIRRLRELLGEAQK